MKSYYLISILFIPLLVTGCAAVRPVSDMALGAGGGDAWVAVGKLIGKQAAGAAGGVLLSEGGFYLAGKASDNAYTTGYEKGRSDAVRQQYWILIHQQQQQKTLPENISLYAIPVPEQTIDGTILNPTTKYLRIEN